MSNPVRLGKKSETGKYEAWVYTYAPYILIICLIILLLLVFALVFTILGVSAHSITGTEANGYYNHFEDLI